MIEKQNYIMLSQGDEYNGESQISHPWNHPRLSVICANVNICNSPYPGTILRNSVEPNLSPGTSAINSMELDISDSNNLEDGELEYNK